METSQVLADYLAHLYGERWQDLLTAPVWVSYSRNGSRGQPLSVQALEQICQKYTGTSQFHMLRHTASLALDDLGVPTSEVQENKVEIAWMQQATDEAYQFIDTHL